MAGFRVEQTVILVGLRILTRQTFFPFVTKVFNVKQFSQTSTFPLHWFRTQEYFEFYNLLIYAFHGRLKNQTNVGNNSDENRKIVGKTNIDRIRSQQIRESCGVQTINERMKRRRREWDQHVKRMDVERLVEISRDNIPVGRWSPGLLKRRWSDLIID